MRTIVKGKNFEVTDRVRRYAERRFKRIERLLDDRTDAIVELSVEHHRSSTDSQIVEVTLVIDGQTLRSHATGLTHQAGIDTVVDKVERQAVEFKEKPRLRARPEAEKQILRRIADGRRVIPLALALRAAAERSAAIVEDIARAACGVKVIVQAVERAI